VDSDTGASAHQHASAQRHADDNTNADCDQRADIGGRIDDGRKGGGRRTDNGANTNATKNVYFANASCGSCAVSNWSSSLQTPMTNQINSHVTQNAPKLAWAGFMIGTVAGFVLGLAASWAGDMQMGWAAFFVGVLFGAVWAFLIMWKTINHQTELENKAADVAVTRANTDWFKTQAPQLAAPATNYQVPTSYQPAPPARPGPQFTQVGKGRFVLSESEPLQAEHEQEDDLNGWPEDVQALRVAYALLKSGKLPTRQNFAEMGLNSGSRYEAIRKWLIEAGMAQSAGDGNPTPWTSHAYKPYVMDAVEKYLMPTALSAQARKNR
jgi:hypothetical protein